MKKIRRIGILTGGGDCPGLNAVIRAVVDTAILQYGIDVYGIIDGYAGLINKWLRKLELKDVSGILPRGSHGCHRIPNRWRFGSGKSMRPS